MSKRNKKYVHTPEEKKPLNRENFGKLLGIFKFILPYRTQFILGMLSLLFSSITLLAFPLFTGKLIDAATGKGDWIINDFNLIALALIGILFIQAIFAFIRVYFFSCVSELSMADVRKSLYKKLMFLPLSFYDKRRSGELISRITSDVSLMQDSFSVTLAELIRQLSTLLIGTVVIFYTTPKLSLFMLATFPVVIIIAMFFGRFIRKLSRKTQDELAASNVVVEETLQAIHMVKAFTNEEFEVGRYRKNMGNVVNIAIKAATYRGIFIAFIIFALFGAIVTVIWYGANLVQAGQLTIGELISFILYTTFIGGSIAGIGDIYGQVQKAIGSSERILEILGQDEELTNHVTGKYPSRLFDREIRFEQINFRYPTRFEAVVLDDMSFHIAGGSKVAFVGHSGAGKSTVVQLLLRFYNPGSGKITVDGHDISEFNLNDYRSRIAIVPQEVILFGGTVRENIAYGRPGAGEMEIIEAAQKAFAWSFIEKFPDKLETLVGERGIKLSGGQRQRIAIARAILRNPELLILDEATSSLDAESERLVQLALSELMKNRTTIIIAHRLSTIRKVDRIFVLDHGKIVETGSHDVLSAKTDGIYSNLAKLQLS